MEWFSDIKNSKIDLSIIIPMYNVEDYIIETLNSMRGVRDFKVELILVDDGSTDNTLNLAKEWAGKSEFDTFILSKENEGPSIARNLGLTKARGELVTFFDSDDIALSYLYTDVINIMLSHKVDFCIFRGGSFDHVTQKVYEFPDYYVWDKIMGEAEFKVLTLQQEPRLARLEPSAVVRVYRKEFITSNEIQFPENLFFEDVLFHAKCVLNATKVALLNKTILLYRVNREGQTTGSFGKKRQDVLKIIDLIISDYSKMKVSNDIWANLIGLLVRMNVWCSENCAYEDKSDFVKKSISLFSKLPNNVIEIYMNEYSYNDWEIKLCKAFIERNEKVLNISAEGGYPIFDNINEPLHIIENKASLDSIDGKLEHLFSQQKEGWAHDRFNVLNAKLEALLSQNKELNEKLERKGSISAVIKKIFKG
ncbi:glycosyltransferase [Klebsiella quasipneumoniae]|uniref:glycosyltransferase family 2 protein n=1 Tax=Klebsiella pneumoniae complex TaxID=3390273 RepID=UPI000E2D0409|nr:MULTISPECIES: glycosyltransferase family 2 protein [Klebsiella]MCW9397723.1 glycosyltransferase [Klebsiella quasipneumoniae]SXN59524.1 capsular polysaccharide biosynthsis protein [Klebsiella pneumoniae]